MKEMVKRLITEESGQGMTEYALILALVSIAAITMLTGLGGRIGAIFSAIANGLNPQPPQ